MHRAGGLLLRLSWVSLLIWQVIWHAMLPLLPAGGRNWTLAIIALVPLLPFTPGVMLTRYRSLIFGMFVVMIYFIIGVMETWANADQRTAAAVQIVLCCLYFAGLVMFNRPLPSPRD